MTRFVRVGGNGTAPGSSLWLMTPLLSQLIHTLRLDRCHARFYLGGPRCRDVRGHPGKHYVFSGFATVHWF